MSAILLAPEAHPSAGREKPHDAVMRFVRDLVETGLIKYTYRLKAMIRASASTEIMAEVENALFAHWPEHRGPLPDCETIRTRQDPAPGEARLQLCAYDAGGRALVRRASDA
jgi:hypothetical protein